MTFIFRTIFWLSAAIVILPPGSRLGGEEIADFRDFDLEHELRSAAISAWSVATTAAGSCDENPEFCKSATKLWVTGWETVAEIANQSRQDAAETETLMKTASNSHKDTTD